ncbi:MAG: BMP family ABC transporter substrate-binding protein [Oscillospiraceae bacterium]|nr:BMP family ABC transporter substrate-binding protein [Oscillospiraceae bacterium]
MKKILTIALALVMVFTLVACAGDNNNNTNGANPDVGSNGDDPNANTNNSTSSENNNDTNGNNNTAGGENNNQNGAEPPSQTDGFELALITDLGTIDDKSFNQGSWEGLMLYADEHNITRNYYKPADQGDDAYLNAIDLAVQGGAKVIVTPGYLFEIPIYYAQDIYPDVKFILLDGSPNDGDWSNGEPNAKVGDNTVAVFYAEEQSGFLAGYAAVMDGYRKLGFMGGMAVPAVIRFGHGYVQGAEVAAQELGLPDKSITINYSYTGVFAPQPEIQTQAAAWYNDGVEVIFSCGGGICFSIFPAAENSGNVVIGVDGDQSGESPTVITSAMKLLTKSVYDKISDYYNGEFPGGQTLVYSAENLGVGLPMGTSKFKTFSQAQYDAVYAKLQNGSIVVNNDIEIAPTALPAKAVVVTYLN